MQNLIKASKILRNKSNLILPGNLLEYSSKSLVAFPRIISNVPKNLFEHSLESVWRLPGII